jgi:hypothetical protein
MKKIIITIMITMLLLGTTVLVVDSKSPTSSKALNEKKEFDNVFNTFNVGLKDLNKVLIEFQRLYDKLLANDKNISLRTIISTVILDEPEDFFRELYRLQTLTLRSKEDCENETVALNNMISKLKEMIKFMEFIKAEKAEKDALYNLPELYDNYLIRTKTN